MRDDGTTPSWWTAGQQEVLADQVIGLAPG
jgi:hypothetical protein